MILNLKFLVYTMIPEKIILQSAGSLSISIIAILLFALQLLIFFKKKNQNWHVWGAAISFSTLLYSVGIFIEYNTKAGPLNRFSGILEFAALILLIHSMYGFTFSYLSIEAKKYHLWAGIFHGLVMILLWGTDLIVAYEFSTWNFMGLESPYVEPAIGVFGPLFEFYIAASAIIAMSIWIRHRRTNIKYRIVFLSGMGLWIVLGIHDGLASLGVPVLQYLMEYGFLGFAFAVLWVVVNSCIEMEIDEKYQLITEQANECIIIVQDEKIVFGNPAFCRLIDEPVISDSSAEKFYKMMHPQERVFYTRIYYSLLKGDAPPERHIMCIKKDNSKERYLEIAITTIKYRGKDAALGVMRDITEQKYEADALRAAEEKLIRLKKMESLGLLAGGVAHDLNNVLAGLINYPELILMDLAEDSRFREPVEGIKASGERAVAIVEDLLTVARGVAVQKEILNINDIIEDYLKSPEHEKLVQFHPSVTIKTCLGPDLANMEGSYIHIRKAIMNLVSNAVEAITGAGNVLISSRNFYSEKQITEHQDSKTGEYIILSVSDDGPGIAQEDIEKIFEPFYSKKVMGRSGTGLGLAVVSNIIQDHRGYIDIETDKNGTTFNIYFPSVKGDALKRKLHVPIIEYQGNNEKILIVDDVASQRKIIFNMLTKLGYDPVTVSSGEEAVEYIKRNYIDLVLVDMIMEPGINGKETYERMIKIRPGQKALILSGFAETDDVKNTLQMGAGKYIKKPFSLEEIGIVIKEVLNKKPKS